MDTVSETNSSYLTNEILYLRLQLEQKLNPSNDHSESSIAAAKPSHSGLSPTPLDNLCSIFQLSDYERKILVLCAAAEIDWKSYDLFKEYCSGIGQQALPTPLIAMNLESGFQFSAFSLDRPLYCWKLIRRVDDTNLLTTPLKIDDWTLQYLLGVDYNNPTFGSHLIPKRVKPDTTLISDAQSKVMGQIKTAWQSSKNASVPPLQLCGIDPPALSTIAALACAEIGYSLFSIDATHLSINEQLQRDWVLDWQRKAMVHKRALFINCGDPDKLDARVHNVILDLVQTLTTPLVLSVTERLAASRSLFSIDVPSLTPKEQAEIWAIHLKDIAHNLNGHLGTLVVQFNMTASAIQDISRQAIAYSRENPMIRSNPQEMTKILWQYCRTHSRSRLEGLVERQEPKTTWDELILSVDATQILKQIIATIRQRNKVINEWEMGGNTQRGIGITAMFYGPPGTGKTTAAEIIAKDLNLDLYRVDLSQVVSKYIGETEKNLAQIFDMAEMSGAVLLFDEADAMIGKRSEVKDSKDRYANQEVSYLLQRMEAYSGLAMLTTNLPNAIDSAFMRRIKFSVRFEYPNPEQRVIIWQKNFANKAPTKGLIWQRLAQLNISGASIKNIALGAAYLAADVEEPIQMKHILQSARAECQKQGRTITDQEIWGWVS
jgi:SpoVK/Ycf46/Vps4 family AAA+-type ATPase